MLFYNDSASILRRPPNRWGRKHEKSYSKNIVYDNW